MTDSFFAFFKGGISNSDDTDPEQSSYFYNPPFESHQNVVIYRRETLALDDGDTRSISLPDTTASSGWVGLMARVIGEAKITTVGVNFDGSSALTGVTVGYGNDRHPGMLSLVTRNVTSYTFEGLADDTTVQYLFMGFAGDDELE